MRLATIAPTIMRTSAGHNLKDQIPTYLHRCRFMGRATLFGFIAAILLIALFIFWALDVIVRHVRGITAAGGRSVDCRVRVGHHRGDAGYR